jgi:4-hydroxy-2-oxoheptanedioate aldolase
MPAKKARKRMNRVIELWEQGQPAYYAGTGPLTYENGKKQAKTWADFLMTDFEHHAFDIVGLTAFMQGLVDGGPTNSGHRIPAVIATLPSNCRTKEEVWANAWQIRHVLSAGVHGILHTHARQPDAVRAFVETCRYPFQTIGVGNGLGEGQRGAGGQALPAKVWGVDPATYTKIADPWPLNPDGELLLGLKLEDRECVANADLCAGVPGLSFAEWGPGDMGMSYGMPDAHDPPYPEVMERARQTIKAACDKHGLRFLSSWNTPKLTIEQQVRKLIKEQGVMVMAGGGEPMARAGRKLTGRKMPV